MKTGWPNIGAALVFLFCAASAVAGNYDDEIRRQWEQKIKQSSAALQHGDYKASLRIANRLIGEMEEMLGPGDSAAYVFGIVVTHKALANAGLGNRDDALWYWHTALALFPRLAEADLSMFGEAGKFLKEHPPEVARNSSTSRPVELPTPNVTAPRVLKHVEPRYPAGAMTFDVSGILIVEVIIDKEGRVSSPRIRKALPAPTLSYAALDAVRQWRFEPGRIGGEPVDVLFNLTVNFKLRP
jgi:TonB family protein